MLGVSKLSWRACWPLLPALLAGALLTVTMAQRRDGAATPAVSLDDWDIPQLAAYLNDEGLGLRLVSTQKDGVIHHTAFLTTTDQEWIDLNHLPKTRQKIDRWQGSLYCERSPFGDWSNQTHQWGDCCLVVGPFLLFGDRELLDRVRAALTPLVPSAERSTAPATGFPGDGQGPE
jgi:hypothetical protein